MDQSIMRLVAQSHTGQRLQVGSEPLSERCKAAPEHDGKPNHEKGMSAKVGGDGKVAIQRGRAQLGLQPGQVWRLPADQGQGSLSQIVSPFWKGTPIYQQTVSISSQQHLQSAPRATTCRIAAESWNSSRRVLGRPIQWSKLLRPASITASSDSESLVTPRMVGFVFRSETAPFNWLNSLNWASKKRSSGKGGNSVVMAVREPQVASR